MCQIVWRWDLGILLNNVSEIIWHDVVVACLEVITINISGVVEKYHRKAQDSICPRWDSNVVACD
jgi:hypothetical protein